MQALHWRPDTRDGVTADEFCPAGVRMQDTLATLGNVHEGDMPDSRYVRPRRLTFQQAGWERHVFCLIRHSSRC